MTTEQESASRPGKTRIEDLLHGDDVDAAVKALAVLNARRPGHGVPNGFVCYTASR